MLKEYEELFSLDKTIAKDLLLSVRYPWDIFESLDSFILSLGELLPSEEYEKRGKGIWVSRDVKIAPSVEIFGPAIIDKGAEIRHGAFIRGSVIIGKGSCLGNSCEIKSSIMLDGACAPHFNYVGNSILGAFAHLGAGAITSNLKSDKSSITVKSFQNIDTGLRKIGAFIGDGAEIGCGTVLNPGTVIGKNSVVYPLSSVRGLVPSYHVYKGEGNIVKREKRD